MLKSGEMQKAVIRGFAQKWYKTCNRSPSGKADFAPAYSSSAQLICISSSWPFLHSSLCHTCVKTFTSVQWLSWETFQAKVAVERTVIFMSACNSTYLQNCPSFTECTYLSAPSLSSPAQSSCRQQVKHVLCKSLPSGVTHYDCRQL